MDSDSADVADERWGHVTSGENWVDLFRNTEGSWRLVTSSTDSDDPVTVSDTEAVAWLVRNNFSFPEEFTAEAAAVAVTLQESEVGSVQATYFSDAEFERGYNSLGPGDDEWQEAPFRSVGIFGNVAEESLQNWKQKTHQAYVRTMECLPQTDPRVMRV